MTRRQVFASAAVAGAGSAATTAFLDVTSLLPYAPWEIALSFPLGAAFFLALWVVGGVR